MDIHSVEKQVFAYGLMIENKSKCETSDTWHKHGNQRSFVP